MNAIGMNAAVGPGGPVSGGMGMNSGSPANQALNPNPEQHIKMQLNTYIYEYFIRLGHYEIARALRDEAKFEIRTKPGVKQSPGRRKDGDVNGIDTDAMDMEMKSDVPDDLLPPALGDPNIASNGFLFEWFSIFSDLYGAHRRTGNANPAAQQYLLQQHVSAFTVLSSKDADSRSEHAAPARKYSESSFGSIWYDEPKKLRCHG